MLLARLADDRLLVVAGDVVEPDAVRVEVVEHRHAELVPLPVVGLRPARAAQYGYKKLLISSSWISVPLSAGGRAQCNIQYSVPFPETIHVKTILSKSPWLTLRCWTS